MTRTTIELRIKRQDTPTAKPRWEEFSLPYRPNMNVISCLMEIRKRPVTKQGAKTSPIAWDAACLEEVCGSCTMLVNGRPCQACSQLVDRLDAGPITLEPLTKFPVVRDLQVDRSPMFDALKKVKAWIPIDGTYDLGFGPKMAEAEREVAYAFSRCTRRINGDARGRSEHGIVQRIRDADGRQHIVIDADSDGSRGRNRVVVISCFGG